MKKQALHWLPVVQRKHHAGNRRPQFVNPLGMLLGGSLFITVALLAILCSLALRQSLPGNGKVRKSSSSCHGVRLVSSGPPDTLPP